MVMFFNFYTGRGGEGMEAGFVHLIIYAYEKHHENIQQNLCLLIVVFRLKSQY